MQEIVGDELTEKQRRTLAVANERSYYDWPREYTADQVTQTMLISSPTLQYRLHQAHRAMMELLFETSFLAVEGKSNEQHGKIVQTETEYEQSV